MRNTIGTLLLGFLIGILVMGITGKISTKDEPKEALNEPKNSQTSDSIPAKTEYQLILDMDTVFVYDGSRYVGCAIDTAQTSPLMSLLIEDNL